MDQQTLAAYDAGAAAFAKDWHEQPPPEDMHVLIRRFFRPGLTADIGCGSGREVAWLDANGFAAIGYDASVGLLAEARRRYPGAKFETSALPELTRVADGSCDNVLCETVIMHLEPTAIEASARRLMSILKPGGILYLSWRVTTGADLRDPQGRLYSAFDKDLVLPQLGDATILLDEAVVSASSGKRIHRIVARKP